MSVTTKLRNVYKNPSVLQYKGGSRVNFKRKMLRKNSELLRQLCRQENLGELEILISSQLEEFVPINLSELEFGAGLTSEEIKEIFPKVKEDVDNFLGTHHIDVPDCDYYNFFKPGLNTIPFWINYSFAASVPIYLTLGETIRNYLPEDLNSIVSNIILSPGLGILTILPFLISFNGYLANLTSGYDPLFRHITLQKEEMNEETGTLRKISRPKLIPIMAHEYAHHVQKKQGLALFDNRVLLEGHARGVERHISELYCEREGNDAFMYGIYNRTITELQQTYGWICRRLEIKGREEFLPKKQTREIGPHAAGNTLFLLWEQTKGSEIYKEVLHH